MKLLLDNTGLHSVGRCLEGKALSRDDVDGLLQVGSELVASRQIHISARESEGIRQRSEQIWLRLASAGFSPDAFELSQFNIPSFVDACREAVLCMEEDLLSPSVFVDADWESVVAARPDLNREEHEEFERFHDILASDTRDPGRGEIQASIQGGQVGSALFALSTHPKFFERLRQYARSAPTWDRAATSALVSRLRGYVYTELSRAVDALYAPAVARARQDLCENVTLRRNLDSSLASLAEELRPEPLGFPPVAATLLVRSKGEPAAFLEEARHLRDLGKPLRKIIEERTQRKDGALKQLAIDDAVREVTDTVRKELISSERPQFVAAISALSVVPVPGVKLDPKKFADWLRFRLSRRKVKALTEVTATAIYSDQAERCYRRHLKNCGTS